MCNLEVDREKFTSSKTQENPKKGRKRKQTETSVIESSKKAKKTVIKNISEENKQQVKIQIPPKR